MADSVAARVSEAIGRGQAAMDQDRHDDARSADVRRAQVEDERLDGDVVGLSEAQQREVVLEPEVWPLMADAGHLFADVSGMVLSLAAVRIAARPRNTSRTFGLYRLEILAAAANAMSLGCSESIPSM